jgi:glycosyltransferase involved in cell wall biosynthesis
MTSISVVIPLYNKAPHIAKTLESVLRQDSAPDEIIVVDDGSTDGSDQIVERLAAGGIKLIRQKNQGVSTARNAGVQEAKSEYVALLDADDYWYPNHLAVMRSLITEYPEAALLSTAHIVERDGNLYRPRSVYTEGEHGIVADFFSAYSVGFSLINSTTACAKRANLLEIGGFPVGVHRGEDIICWIRLALKYPVAHAEVVTAVYVQNAVNRSIHRRDPSPPGSLVFLTELWRGKELTPEQSTSAKRLFDKIAFFTGAGLRIQGDRTGLSAIRKLAFDSGRRSTGLALLALEAIPPFTLRWAQRLRHPRANS